MFGNMYGWVPQRFICATELGQPLPFPLLLKKTVAVDTISIIFFKNNLRIDYRKSLTCFCGYFEYYLGILLIDRAKQTEVFWI